MTLGKIEDSIGSVCKVPIEWQFCDLIKSHR